MANTDYKAYFSYNNAEQGFRIPYISDSIELKLSGSNDTATIIGLGEISQINDPSLTSWTIQTEFPAFWSPAIPEDLKNNLLKPNEYVTMLSNWMRSKRPIRFILTNSAVPMNIACTIENLSFTENGNEPGTIYAEIDLKRYTFHEIRRVSQGSVTGSVILSGTTDTGAI
jgi:hypothetical protein